MSVSITFVVFWGQALCG